MTQKLACLVMVASVFSAPALASTPTELSSFEMRERNVKTLSLKQAIVGATTNHPAVKSANIAVDISAIGEKSAWCGYLPTINIQGNAYGDKNTGTPQMDAVITGKQFLLGGSSPSLKAAQAKVDTKIAHLSRDLTVQQRRAHAEDLFLQAWLKQEERMLRERQYNASEEMLRLKKRHHDAGLITDADYEAALAETSAQETALESNQDELQALVSELEDITGFTLSDDSGVFCTLTWQPDVDQTIQPASFYIDIALSNRLELDLNNAARERALADEKFASSQILPTISVTGQYTRGFVPALTPAEPVATPDNLSSSSFFAGLQASWNIFDGNQSKLAADTARARALKNSTEREISKKKITKEVKKLHSSLKAAQKQTRSLQAQLSATQEANKLSQQLNMAGVNTDADVLAADSKNYATEFACLSQVVGFQRSLFALNAACGYALDTITT